MKLVGSTLNQSVLPCNKYSQNLSGLQQPVFIFLCMSLQDRSGKDWLQIRFTGFFILSGPVATGDILFSGRSTGAQSKQKHVIPLKVLAQNCHIVPLSTFPKQVIWPHPASLGRCLWWEQLQSLSNGRDYVMQISLHGGA